MNPNLANAFVAGAVALAIFFYGGPTQLFLLGVISVMLMALGVSLFSNFSNGMLSWSRIHSGLLVWTILLLLNFQLSESPDVSLPMLWVFLVMHIAVLLLSQMDDQHWSKLQILLAIPLAYSAIWGIAEFLGTTGRASGPVADPNTWAGGLNLSFFLFAAAYYIAPKRWVPVLFILLGVLATASFMSYSRVGLLVFGAALVFSSLIALSNPRWRKKSVALLIICAVSFASVQLIRPMQAATNNTEGFTLRTQAYGWTVRFAQWQSALNQAADYPILSSGLATFGQLYPQYRTLDDDSTAGFFVHNDYLQLLAEVGPVSILMVATFIGFLLWQLYLAVRRLVFDRSRGDPNLEIQVLLLVVAIGTVLVHAIMNFTIYNLLNQLLIGCALARLIYLRRLSKTISLEGIRPGLMKFVTVLVIGFSLAVQYADAVTRDLVYRGGIIPLDRSNPNHKVVVFDILSTIRSFRSGSASNRFAMATFYRSSFDEQPMDNLLVRESLAIATALEYQSGLELNPRYDDIRGFFADFLIENPWLSIVEEIYQTPERLYREGLDLTPLRLRARVSLARYLNQQGREDEAYDVLLSGVGRERMRYPEFRSWRVAWQSELRQAATKRGDQATLASLLDSL